MRVQLEPSCAEVATHLSSFHLIKAGSVALMPIVALDGQLEPLVKSI